MTQISYCVYFFITLNVYKFIAYLFEVCYNTKRYNTVFPGILCTFRGGKMMKRNLMSVFFFILLIVIHVTAFASENTYIVTLNDTVSLFNMSTNNERDYVVVSADELKDYLDSGIVKEYEPNYKIELLSDNWNLDAVNCQFAWELGCFGNEVKIGIIDSGLYPFEELEPNIIAGKNYLDGSDNTTDNIGHGTYVAGIIASKSKGISHKSKIIPLKCFDNDADTYVSHLLDAIDNAVNVYKCDVINMSLGMTTKSTKLEEAITKATNKGVIVLAAAGKGGSTTMFYPAGYNNAVGVGSINKNYTKSSFSPYNSSIFVTAPGEGFESLKTPNYSISTSGTSFATPHVTALAAVAKCIDNSINTDEFMYLLSETSQDLGDFGYDTHYGHGLVNFEGFLSKLLENTEIFVSPLYVENNKIFGTLYNNTLKRQAVTLINSNYSGNMLLNTNTKSISLGAKQKYNFENAINGNISKFLLWDSLSNMLPVINSKTQYIN